MYESSAASASEDFSHLFEGAGLDESSEDLDHLVGSAVVSQQAERIYGRKTPRPTRRLKHNRKTAAQLPVASKAAAGKQPMSYQGRGKTHIGYQSSYGTPE